MNEHGLVVGMAAVPPGGMTPDPDKPTIGSLGIIRQILDKAQTVEEAIDIFEQFNVDHGGGPPIHYLIADRYGEVVLVEFYKGEIVLTYADSAWHQTTNFLRASAGDFPEGRCWRYDLLMDRLTDAQGALTSTSAMELLADVAQENTQWSVVYDFSSGGINIAMDRTYSDVHSFQLDLAVP